MSRQCPLCGESKPEEALFCENCEKKIRMDYEIDLPVSRNDKAYRFLVISRMLKMFRSPMKSRLQLKNRSCLQRKERR